MKENSFIGRMASDWNPKKVPKRKNIKTHKEDWNWFFKDSDKDGLMNGVDCKPYNRKKQDSFISLGSPNPLQQFINPLQQFINPLQQFIRPQNQPAMIASGPNQNVSMAPKPVVIENKTTVISKPTLTASTPIQQSPKTMTIQSSPQVSVVSKPNYFNTSIQSLQQYIKPQITSTISQPQQKINFPASTPNSQINNVMKFAVTPNSAFSNFPATTKSWITGSGSNFQSNTPEQNVKNILTYQQQTTGKPVLKNLDEVTKTVVSSVQTASNKPTNINYFDTFKSWVFGNPNMQKMAPQEGMEKIKAYEQLTGEKILPKAQERVITQQTKTGTGLVEPKSSSLTIQSSVDQQQSYIVPGSIYKNPGSPVNTLLEIKSNQVVLDNKQKDIVAAAAEKYIKDKNITLFEDSKNAGVNEATGGYWNIFENKMYVKPDSDRNISLLHETSHLLDDLSISSNANEITGKTDTISYQKETFPTAQKIQEQNINIEKEKNLPSNLRWAPATNVGEAKAYYIGNYYGGLKGSEPKEPIKRNEVIDAYEKQLGIRTETVPLTKTASDVIAVGNAYAYVAQNLNNPNFNQEINKAKAEKEFREFAPIVKKPEVKVGRQYEGFTPYESSWPDKNVQKYTAIKSDEGKYIVRDRDGNYRQFNTRDDAARAASKGYLAPEPGFNYQ